MIFIGKSKTTDMELCLKYSRANVSDYTIIYVKILINAKTVVYMKIFRNAGDEGIFCAFR